ncbi:MAG: hypothetical protein ACTHKN_17305 [Achromobacter mucicolens]|uniref:hypothetical protein n=1 Tax=Achromobacter mucicolens TaxID=1389922 RepID=UPI003974F746
MNAINLAESATLVSEPLRIQPVLDAKGVVREMALVGGQSWHGPALLANAASADALRRAGRVFRAAGCMAPLSIDHPLNVNSDILLPRQLCEDLRIGAVAGDQLRETPQESHPSLPIYPCGKVTYNVPLSDRLAHGAALFHGYQELRPALRVRLLPSAQASFGTLRATGLRVGIPEGICTRRPLQERFFSLLGQASRQGLKVLAQDIRRIEDFNWLRAQPDVLFQGEALSIALSLQYVQDWLTSAGSNWREFQLGT